MKIARGAAFDSFLNRLRDEKFVIGVDRLIRVEQVMRTHGDTLTPRELRSRLCPLIASSQQQQERFDALFEDWFLPEPEKPKAPPRKPQRWWIGPIALLVLIFAAAVGLDLWSWYNVPIPPPPALRQIGGYNLPQAMISSEPSGSELPIGKPIVFDGSKSEAFGGAPVSYSWTLSQKPDGSRARLSRTTQGTTTLVPDRPGAYTVQLTVYDGIANSNPYEYGVAVGDHPISSSTDVMFPFDRWIRSTTLHVVNLAPLRWLLILLGLTFAYFVRHYWQRRVILDRFRQADRERSYAIRTLTLPADPRTEATAAAALRSLRRPVLGRLRLSIPKSVAATICNGGFPSLMFESSRMRPEYLVLIDTLSTRDHQSTMFQAMIQSLGKHGLQVFAYLYAGDPRVCRPMAGFTRGGPKTLNDLVSRHAGARVMLFGDAGQLFFEGSTEVQPWVQPTFDQWPERFIFTPKTVDRWSDREAILKKDLLFELLPATQDSLRAFAIRGARFDFYEPSWDYANAESLRADLYPQVYQWLCACALYPRLEWILTVRLGLALDLYSEQNCLQLIRLPWFRQGEMPVDLQQELVESMKPEERKRARQAMRQLLNEARQGEASSEESRIKFEIGVQELDMTPKERQQIRRDLAVARNALKSDKAWYLQLPAHLRNVLMIDSRWMSKRTWQLSLIGVQALLVGGLSLLGTVGWGEIIPKHWGPLSPDITDGNWLATGSDDKTARVMEAPTGVELSRFTLDSAVTSLAYRPDGKWLATGSRSRTVRVIDVRTGKKVDLVFVVPDRGARDPFSPGQELLRVRIEQQTGVRKPDPAAESSPANSVTSVAFSPDGKWLAASRLDGNVWLVETSPWQEIWTQFYFLPIHKVVFSPDSNLVATAVGDHTARVIEASTGTEVSRLNHQAPVNDVAFSPDSKWVATGSFDKTARVFEAATGKEVSRLTFQGAVYAVAFSPDGKWVATGSFDKTARVFEAATGKEVSRLTLQDTVYAVGFSPDGKWVATASGDKTARVFEAATGKEVSRLTFQGRLNAVAFSPDGKWVAAASDDKTARVFEAATGKEVSRLIHRGSVNAIAFSPRGIKSPESTPPIDAVVSTIPTNWDKPNPTTGNFQGSEGVCGPFGDGGDEETNFRRNRTDVPAQYHDVTWSTIKNLKYPIAGTSLKVWTRDELAQIGPYQGVAVRTVGYLAANKVEGAESTNCHFTGESDVDWHIALVEHAGDAEGTSVVVETTPRIRVAHPNWTRAVLSPWLKSDKPVRITGWLLFDPSQRNQLGKYRSTLWEIHPITKIEVSKDGQWVDLDQLPGGNLSVTLPSAALVLKRAWIEKFRNRATIEGVSFTIDHAHPRPNPGSVDGDMQAAGRAPTEIGLPMVAELMNADNNEPAVKLIHANEGTGQSIAVAGAWRIWFEHPPSTGSQIQFDTVPPADNTNPDHYFEIHPLTKVGPNDLTDHLKDIPGFTPKDATAAFGSYEKLSIAVRATNTAATLISNKAGYNYVLFTMITTEKTAKLDDGGIAVMADVVPVGGDHSQAVARQVRMIFVPGSTPWKSAQNLPIGSSRTVLGIPRINLNAITSFFQGGSQESVVTRKLPYEMIIVSLR